MPYSISLRSVAPTAEPLRRTSRTISSASLQSTICAESLYDVENLDIESLVEQVREMGGPLFMDEDERSFDSPLNTSDAAETTASPGDSDQLLTRNDGYDIEEDEYEDASDDEDQLATSATPTLSADTVSVDLDSSAFSLSAPNFTSEEDWQDDDPGVFEGGVGEYADVLQIETGSPRRLALARKLRQSDGFGFVFVEPGH
ncbi:hypothetical protein HDU81_007090 [Chytriomyces hyalinus]|nr:hypothetical protein HDU81_007090 [Chytriomyces hyalinus]